MLRTMGDISPVRSIGSELNRDVPTANPSAPPRPTDSSPARSDGSYRCVRLRRTMSAATPVPDDLAQLTVATGSTAGTSVLPGAQVTVAPPTSRVDPQSLDTQSFDRARRESGSGRIVARPSGPAEIRSTGRVARASRHRAEKCANARRDRASNRRPSGRRDRR